MFGNGASVVFSPGDGINHSGVISSDNAVSASGDLSNSSKDLPALTIEYSKLISQGGDTPVLIENVALSLGTVTAKNGSAANDITACFDLTPGFGPYVIKSGTTVLGTTADTHVAVHNLPLGKDIVLAVEPQAEGAVGTNYTIAAADIDALFPVPSVAADADVTPMLHGAYTLGADRSVDIRGAARAIVTTTVPAARLYLSNSGAEILFKGHQDAFDAIVPDAAAFRQILYQVPLPFLQKK